MKKLLVGVLLLLTLSFSLPAWETTIQTSRGEQTLTLPEGMTFEEAYIHMAKMYLEERFDHEDLIISAQTLVKQVESFRHENQKLYDLYVQRGEQYKNLSSLYEEALRKRFIIPSMHIGALYGIEEQQVQVQGMFGVIVLERLSFHTLLQFPFAVGMSVGVQW